jgi:hypothetical protein
MYHILTAHIVFYWCAQDQAWSSRTEWTVHHKSPMRTRTSDIISIGTNLLPIISIQASLNHMSETRLINKSPSSLLFSLQFVQRLLIKAAHDMIFRYEIFAVHTDTNSINVWSQWCSSQYIYPSSHTHTHTHTSVRSDEQTIATMQVSVIHIARSHLESTSMQGSIIDEALIIMKYDLRW